MTEIAGAARQKDALRIIGLNFHVTHGSIPERKISIGVSDGFGSVTGTT